MVLATKIIQAKRYAQAVFQIAQERQELDKWQLDLKKLTALTSIPEFVAVMDNPNFAFDDKTRLMGQQVTDVSSLALNLAYLLITRGNLNFISSIAFEYQSLLDNYRGIEMADVTTAVPLEGVRKSLLSKQLEALTGKIIAMNLKVDPEIIGGIIIRIAGKLIDGSTASRLTALKDELANAGSQN
jgi:F-type H+-transporting ATPase subunit delta